MTSKTSDHPAGLSAPLCLAAFAAGALLLASASSDASAPSVSAPIAGQAPDGARSILATCLAQPGGVRETRGQRLVALHGCLESAGFSLGE